MPYALNLEKIKNIAWLGASVNTLADHIVHLLRIRKRAIAVPNDVEVAEMKSAVNQTSRMDSSSLISGLSVIAFKKAVASRLAEQFAHDYGPMRYYKRTSECSFRQKGPSKGGVWELWNSGKSP